MAPRPKRSPLRAIASALILFFDAAVRELFRRPGGDRAASDWTQVPDRRPRLVSAWTQVPDRRPRVVSEWKPLASGKRRVRRRRRLPVRRTLAIATLLLLGGAVTLALFTKTTANSGNTYASAADFRAPTVSAAVIQPNGGNNGSAGYVKQGQSYFVYANVADTGAPASGISSVTGNVCNVTTASCSSVAMTAGSYTVNSISYNYRSAAQTASNPLSEGSKSYTITATDVAGNSNSGSPASFNVTVDNTGPAIARSITCNSTGCTSDYVGTSKTYYVYGQVTDTGGTGVNTVNANLAVASNVITTGATSVSMTTSGGPWTIGGNTYNYRSAQQTADAGLVDASTKNYTVTATDNITNSSAPTDTATVDNTPPTVPQPDLDKNFGRFQNRIRANAPYFLYASASDAASGVDTSDATANVAIDVANTLSTGKTNVALCFSGSGYSVPIYHSTTNNIWDFKSDSDGVCDASFTTLTSDSGLPEGSRDFQVTITDNAGNSSTTSRTAILNNTQNTASDAKIYNSSGGTPGQLELGDQINFNFSDSTDPASVFSGWDGSGSDGTGNVVARLINGGGTCVASSDQLQVWNATNTTQTNLGTVCLGGTNYTTSDITFGLTGTPSTLEAGFTNPLQLTLGTPSGTAGTQGTDTTATWTPGTGMYDLSGNTTLTTPTSYSVDNTAPTITRTQIQRTANNNPGFFKQGDAFYVYTEVADANSGIKASSITANVAVAGNVISTGDISVLLCSNGGPFTVGGQSYTYRSDDDGTCGGTATATTSDASITDGSKTYNLTVQDNVNNDTIGTPTATEDSTAPAVSVSTLSKQTGYLKDRLKSAVAYYPYANVTDAGVGVSTVTANVSNVTAGQTALAMTSGSYSTQGTTYNYRPASTVTSGTLTNAATYTWTLTPTDLLGNTATPSGTSATGDTAVPDASDIQCTNVGTAGLPNNGDICNFTHTENIDPFSVAPIASWTGTSTTVAVRFLNDGTGSVPAACDTGTNDTMVIYNAANTAQITAMGCVNLGATTYVTANTNCTASTLIQTSVPGAVNRVTLGGCGTFTAGSGTTTLGYYPSTSLYDAAGNNLTDTTVQNETGTADRDF